MGSALQQGKPAPARPAFCVKQIQSLSDSANQFKQSLGYIAYEQPDCISDQARKRCAMLGSFSRLNNTTCGAALMP